MKQQLRISLERNQAQVGKTLNALIERNGDGLSLGRSYPDAPEIGGMVIVEGDLPVGAIVPVRITGALAYDLTGVASRPSPLPKWNCTLRERGSASGTMTSHWLC